MLRTLGLEVSRRKVDDEISKLSAFKTKQSLQQSRSGDQQLFRVLKLRV